MSTKTLKNLNRRKHLNVFVPNDDSEVLPPSHQLKFLILLQLHKLNPKLTRKWLSAHRIKLGNHFAKGIPLQKRHIRSFSVHGKWERSHEQWKFQVDGKASESHDRNLFIAYLISMPVPPSQLPLLVFVHLLLTLTLHTTRFPTCLLPFSGHVHPRFQTKP